MLDVVWDMETGDPDDFLTLLVLLGHPRVRLLGVTITPGTPEQVGVVRWALAQLGRDDVPVGVFDLEHQTKQGGSTVSGWHHKAYGAMPPSRDCVPGPALLHALCGPTTTLVTGGPLKNLGAALAIEGFALGRLVAQGGFAGEGVVPPERQLEKFRGLVTCPTYNLNGDVKAALAVLATPAIAAKRFVAKNVCHGVVYDADVHARVAAVTARSRALALVWQGMDAYLRASPEGKKFHDPLAACCAIDESIGEWADVELFRGERGAWGARLAPGSATRIITGYDREKFLATLTEL